MRIDNSNDKVIDDSGSEIGGAGAAALKAWVQFNGTGTPAINGSLNVSSISKVGTGHYQINFTTAMADTNYAVIGSISSAGALLLTVDTRTTTYCRVYTGHGAPAWYTLGDSPDVNVMILGS